MPFITNTLEIFIIGYFSSDTIPALALNTFCKECVFSKTVLHCSAAGRDGWGKPIWLNVQASWRIVGLISIKLCCMSVL